MEVVLRKADNSDIDELIEIERGVAGTKIYVPMLSHDEWLVALDIGAVYLIEKDKTIVGNISYEKKSPGRVRISGLVISRKFQGQHLGRQALAQVMEELKDIKRIDLDVHPDNERALKLYQSFGFTEESRKENFYGDGEPRLILVLQK